MRYQPQGLQRINRRSPLTRGLTFAKSVPGTATPAALGKATPSGAMPVEIKAVGRTTRFAGYGTPVIDTDAGRTAKGTVLVLHQSTVLPPNGGYPNPGYSHILAATTSGNITGNGWLLQLANGTGNLSFRIYNADNGSDVAAADGTVPLNDGKPHVTVATWGTAVGDTINTYVDGVLHVAGSALSQAVTIAQPMRLGRSRETSEFWAVFDGTMALVMAWDRILSPAEVSVISANPWQVFDAPDEDDFARYAAGPTYILTGVGGSYSVTGAASTLSARRRLAAAVASLAITPAAALLRVARRMTATAGSLSFTGNAASLKATRKLPAGSGALSLAGGVAGFVAARRLPVAVGSIDINGNAASLTAARKLTAAPGAFALNGGTATFVYTPKPGGQGPTYTLTGGGGAFLVTAGTARLLPARRLLAAAGAFGGAGSPVALVATRRLSASAGSLAIVAAPAGVRATRRLSAVVASFSLTGSAATLFYSPIHKPDGPTYTLTAVGGAMGLTGNGIGMRARRRLSGAAGQLAITGWTANLVYGQQIIHARAPTGSGYTPRQTESETRPSSVSVSRPAATQRNYR